MSGVVGFLQYIFRSTFYDDGSNISIRLHGESDTEGTPPTGNINDLQKQSSTTSGANNAIRIVSTLE